jgi:hypothetical protein
MRRLRRTSLELRCDHFRRIEGFNFDGLSINAGIHLFDVKL